MATTGDNEEVAKLAALIRGIKIAMLTTVDDDGALRSRPMATQEEAFDGSLWFFTRERSPKVEQSTPHRQVSVIYSDPQHGRYISVSGMADLIRDKDKFKELWRPPLAAWFPGGVEDPELSLLKIAVVQAEYWDSPSGSLAKILIAAKAAVGGSRPDEPDHAKLILT